MKQLKGKDLKAISKETKIEIETLENIRDKKQKANSAQKVVISRALGLSIKEFLSL